MSHVLVTGSNGFIGSHLVERLLDDGYKVVGIDNFSMGKEKNLPKHKNLTVHKADILDDEIGKYFDGVSTVFHLAALTRPRESFVNPIETDRVNVNGTVKVLNHCKAKNVKSIVFMSSASVYGFQDRYPLFETIPVNPASPYALTKLIGETYCQFFGKTFGMSINCVRPFNVYGERQDPNGPYAAAVPKFIDTLKNDGEPFITGDGKQFRDFVHVSDVVDLLVKVSESKISGETFNAGSGSITSINALYETICGVMGKTVAPKYVERVDEPNTFAGIGKAEALVGWKPQVSLIEGLTKMI